MDLAIAPHLAIAAAVSPVAEVCHLDLDGAWPADLLGEGTHLDAREWGPRLRYSTRGRDLREFAAHTAAHASRFTLFGSGDFHHMVTVWLDRQREPFVLLSFDNHPDWDIRPPRWGCGTWISRALESPLLQRAVIWGCGNFELDRPGSFFANHRGLRAGRLLARPWADRLKPASRPRWPVLYRETWREEFAQFATRLGRAPVYVTVDLDCLRREESVTNWENGLFTADDVAWAIARVRENARVVGGDLCGAYSPPRYARFRQRLEARIDHPALPPIDPAAALACNLRAWRTIWPALIGA